MHLHLIGLRKRFGPVVHAPDAGRIEIDGQVHTIGSPREAMRLGIGMVFGLSGSA